MSGLQPGEMRDNNAKFTATCPDCGQEIEERTFDQGNVWVHIKVSPKGNKEISRTCFAPEPERLALVGEIVHIFIHKASLEPTPAIVTRANPGAPERVELTVFADTGPMPMVEAYRSDEPKFGCWKFTD